VTARPSEVGVLSGQQYADVAEPERSDYADVLELDPSEYTEVR
jgi:hypothetical protein